MLLLNKCVQTDEIELDKLSELIGLKEVLDSHKNHLEQKQEEYLEFISFLSEKEDWDQELVLIKRVDWDNFYNSLYNDEDEDIKITGWTQASKFYDKFNELLGIGFKEFEQCFVSAKYIDKYTYNTIELTVRINDKDEVFVIDAV